VIELLFGLGIPAALVVGFLLGRRTHASILGAATTVQAISQNMTERVLAVADSQSDVGDKIEAMKETITLQGRILDGQGRVIQTLIDELRQFRLLTTGNITRDPYAQVGEDTDPIRAHNRAVAAAGFGARTDQFVGS
jgi:hypothetical protein